MITSVLDFVDRRHILKPDSVQFPRLTKPSQCVSCYRTVPLVDTKNNGSSGRCVPCYRFAAAYGKNRLTGTATITTENAVQVYIGTGKPLIYDIPDATVVRAAKPFKQALLDAFATQPPYILAYYGKKTFNIDQVRMTLDKRSIQIGGLGLETKTASPILKSQRATVTKFNGEIVERLLKIDRGKHSWEKIFFYTRGKPTNRLTEKEAAIRDEIVARFGDIKLPPLHSSEYRILEFLS